MRLVSYKTAKGHGVGALVAGAIIDVGNAVRHCGNDETAVKAMLSGDLKAVLATGDVGLAALRRMSSEDPAQKDMIPIEAAQILPPIRRPDRILGVGRNYPAHASEAGVGRQAKPRIFVKLSTSIIGHGETIRRPPTVTKLDYEVELAVVIGRRTGPVPPSKAMSVVFGFTIANDVSAREMQMDVSPPQTSFGKSSTGFCPIGPCIVPTEDVDWRDTMLRCWINGELVQEDTTASMVFDVPTIVSHVSQYTDLDPGDLILTGTPAGVGAFLDPPRFLQSGDRIRMQIDGIGELENTIG